MSSHNAIEAHVLMFQNAHGCLNGQASREMQVHTHMYTCVGVQATGFMQTIPGNRHGLNRPDNSRL